MAADLKFYPHKPSLFFLHTKPPTYLAIPPKLNDKVGLHFDLNCVYKILILKSSNAVPLHRWLL